MAMKRFSKIPKMGKRPMMMALTALVIIFLFWFFFMRRREGFREGINAKQVLQNDANKYNKMDSAAKAAYDKKHANQAANIKKLQAAAAAKKGPAAAKGKTK